MSKNSSAELIKVISVGGSIICPNEVDTVFLSDFTKMAVKWLAEDERRKLILVAGGGSIARKYQDALKATSKLLNECKVLQSVEKEKVACKAGETVSLLSESGVYDWLGIRATRLNAQLLKSCFGSLCPCEVICDPTKDGDFSGRVIVAAGWKPGFSTDMDAVVLAKRFGAKTIINLSNIEKVYTDDPKKNPAAKPLDKISWEDFCKIVGDEWRPGLNAPFDPIASKTARDESMTVICASGKNNENTFAILSGKDFVGTVIG